MSTCRVCGKSEYARPFGHAGDDTMIKYSTRHYAHAGCGLDKWGAAFFDRLTRHQCDQFPYFTAKNRGLLQELSDHSTQIP